MTTTWFIFTRRMANGISADGSSTGAMERAVAVAAVADNTKAAGVDASTMTKGMSLQTGQVKPSDGTSEAVRYMLAIVFSVLFMMSAIYYGVMIANSVVTETSCGHDRHLDLVSRVQAGGL